MNLIFVFKVVGKVKDEVKAVLYGEGSSNKSALVLVFSTLCTFQTTRLFFGSFKGLKLFSMSEEYSVELRQPLNKHSIIQAILVNLPVIGVTVLELVRLSSGSELYTSALDSSAISVLLVTLLVRESIKDQADVMRIKLKVIDRIKDAVLSRVKTEKSEKILEKPKTEEENKTSINNPTDSSKGRSQVGESNSVRKVKMEHVINLESEGPFIRETKEKLKDVIEIKLTLQGDQKPQRGIRIKEKESAQRMRPNFQQGNSRWLFIDADMESVRRMLSTKEGDSCQAGLKKVIKKG
eukprot:TRINITY_DN15094_c0_g1_i1.p1 TRINITY_DN15094_c0_g1~~TRINITY_DN15094_c0_g1_i1.p1  ORF type:complete len:294 (-),score=51.35 TRINITY_DN15094_c0_g1_i1:105-986(-)